MKLFSFSLFAVGAGLIASVAMADEVDFYRFRTVHSKNANNEATFKIEVLETSAVDSTVNKSEKFKCKARPTTPDRFTCRVRGNKMLLNASETSARMVLGASNGVLDAEVTEAKDKGKGVFQFRVSHDRIFHVVLSAPEVADDSMECEIGVISEKSVATVACRSEFYPEQRFMVKDIPVFMMSYGWIGFGAANIGNYENREEWAAKNKDAIAKAQQVVAEFNRFKKKVFISNPQNINSVAFNPSATSKSEFFKVNAYYYYYSIRGTDLSDLRLRGKVQIVHRGVEGRRGD